MRRAISNLVLFCAVAGGCAAMMWLVAWLVRPQLSDRPLPYTAEQIAQAENDRDVRFDPKDTRRCIVISTLSQGRSADAGGSGG